MVDVSDHISQTGREKQRAVKNAVANWLGFACTAAVTFFMSPFLVHSLGDQRYGVWSLVDSVIAYLALADLGVGAAVLRYVAKFEGAKDRDSLNRIFNTSLAIFLVGGVVVLVISLGLAFLWPRPLGVGADLAGDVRWLLSLLGVNLAIGLPLGIYGTVLSALRRYPQKTAVHVAMLVMRSGLLVLVVNNGEGIPGVALTITACSLAEYLASAWLVHRFLPELRLSLSLADRGTLRTIFGYSAFVFLALIAGRVATGTDVIVVAAFFTPEYITYFAIAARLVAYARESVFALTTVLTPTISYLQAVGDEAGIQSVFSTGTRCVLYLALPIQIGGLLLGHQFLSLWMGPRFADLCYPTLIILLAPVPLALSKQLSLRILYGVGRVRLVSLFAVVEAAASLVLCIQLAHQFGSIEGVAVGTVIPITIVSLAVTGLACRELGYSLAMHLARASARPVLASSVFLIVWWIAHAYIDTPSWRIFFASFFGLTLPYAAVVLMLEPAARRILVRMAAATSRVMLIPGLCMATHRRSESTQLPGEDLMPLRSE